MRRPQVPASWITGAGEDGSISSVSSVCRRRWLSGGYWAHTRTAKLTPAQPRRPDPRDLYGCGAALFHVQPESSLSVPSVRRMPVKQTVRQTAPLRNLKVRMTMPGEAYRAKGLHAELVDLRTPMLFG